MTPAQLAATFDATNLRLDATEADLRVLCEEAAASGCAAVCLYPANVPLAASILRGTTVKIATVAGFPSGRFSISAKVAEAREVAKKGADECDFVMNYPALIAGDESLVVEELAALCATCREEGLTSKIIVETCYLNMAQKARALTLCEEAGADFIKTSTGFGSGGAELEDVQSWAAKRKAIKIKASGGIRTLRQALAFVEAGANRLGLSSSHAILAEMQGQDSVPPGGAGY